MELDVVTYLEMNVCTEYSQTINNKLTLSWSSPPVSWSSFDFDCFTILEKSSSRRVWVQP